MLLLYIGLGIGPSVGALLSLLYKRSDLNAIVNANIFNQS